MQLLCSPHTAELLLLSGGLNACMAAISFEESPGTCMKMGKEWTALVHQKSAAFLTGLPIAVEPNKP